MFDWLRELKEIWHEKAPCESCEILKVELSSLRREKELLLQHALYGKSLEPERIEAPEPQPLPSRHKPWKVKQQELEAADRVKAQQILREFRTKESAARNTNPVPIAFTPASTIEELEQNLGIVEEK